MYQIDHKNIESWRVAVRSTGQLIDAMEWYRSVWRSLLSKRENTADARKVD